MSLYMQREQTEIGGLQCCCLCPMFAAKAVTDALRDGEEVCCRRGLCQRSVHPVVHVFLAHVNGVPQSPILLPSCDFQMELVFEAVEPSSV
eukprot:6276363-Amphidinium_carterae.2